MRRLLALACRAFSPDHHARSSDEVVDTAILASRGSTFGALREALSLVGAGLWQRLRSESRRSLQDGVRVLAGVLAVVNLAVALAGVVVVTQPLPIYHSCLALSACEPMYPFGVDWWWIAFTAAAVGIVLGLWLGDRRLAVAAGMANLAIVAYDALLLVDPNEWFIGHLGAFTYAQQTAFPVSRFWLPAAIVLVLATAAAPVRRLPLTRLVLALGAALVLVVLSREIAGSFWFLLWPLSVIAVLAIAFGGVAPRLGVLALGGVLVAIPSAVGYLTAQSYPHGSALTWAVTCGLAVGFVVPLAHLLRRRLT
jgi:hypothetical protein